MPKKLTPEQFYALSRRERAVLIAKDLLKRLRRNKLEVKSNYGYVVGIAEKRRSVLSEISDVIRYWFPRRIAEMKQAPKAYTVQRELMKLLRRTFSTAQAREIEAAFERGWGCEDSDSEMLARIMEHIIRNNGSFKAKQFALEEEARDMGKV